MTVLIDNNVLSEPMRERPDAEVMAELEQAAHSLQTASLVIHELSCDIQHLTDGRRKERFRSDLQNLLSSALPSRRLMGCSCSTGSLRHDPPDHL